MAVIVKYVVVRDGKDDMIFTTKKEADAYDKMLDIAEQLYRFLHTSEIDISDDQLDELTFFMSQNRDQIGKLLKGGSLDDAKSAKAEPVKAEKGEDPEGEPQNPPPVKGPRAAKSKAAA